MATDEHDAEGVVLGEAHTAPTPSTRCPVCGQSLETASRSLLGCPSCRTLHHEECWRYLGGCAVYGCSQAPASMPVPLAVGGPPAVISRGRVGFITDLAPRLARTRRAAHARQGRQPQQQRL